MLMRGNFVFSSAPINVRQGLTFQRGYVITKENYYQSVKSGEEKVWKQPYPIKINARN